MNCFLTDRPRQDYDFVWLAQLANHYTNGLDNSMNSFDLTVVKWMENLTFFLLQRLDDDNNKQHLTSTALLEKCANIYTNFNAIVTDHIAPNLYLINDVMLILL